MNPSATSVAHVAQRRRVAEGEAQLRLQALLAGARRQTPCLAEVVGDRLLAKDVLPVLDGSRGQLGVRVARRAHVDDVDVVASDEIEMAVRDFGNVEAARRLFSQRALRIGDGDDATASSRADSRADARRAPTRRRPARRHEAAERHSSADMIARGLR